MPWGEAPARLTPVDPLRTWHRKEVPIKHPLTATNGAEQREMGTKMMSPNHVRNVAASVNAIRAHPWEDGSSRHLLWAMHRAACVLKAIVLRRRGITS